jgi:hypothetical protein
LDRVRSRRELGPRPADVEQAVVVGAPDAGLHPRLRPERFEIVTLRQLLDFRLRQPVEHGLEGLAVQGAVGAVVALETLEQQQQPLKVPALQLLVLAVDRVGDGVGDLFARDIGGDVVDVFRQRLQRLVVGAADAVDEDVHLALVLGEPARELFADEHAGLPVDDPQHALDRVVVGDRDEVHAAALRLRVNLGGGAVALGAVDRVERGLGGLVAGVAVAVQVGTRPAENVG